jgi:site-specific recombinase XerD
MSKLHVLIDKFIADVCAGKHNETERAYRTKLRQLERFAQNRRITLDLMKEFIHDLKTRPVHMRGRTIVKGGLSEYTIKTTVQTARHFCKWLFENKHIKDNIALLIKLPSVHPPTPKAISEDAVNQLFKSASDNVSAEWESARDIAILHCLRDTGGRVGGLANTVLSNVDLNRGVIATIEKGRSINLYINEPTVLAIKTWLVHRAKLNPLTDHLFISDKTNQGLTRQGIERMVNRLAKAAGVKGFINPHAWRHAFARDFLLNGGEITQLAELMNHSSIWVTTNYYSRWNYKELKRAHTAHSPINQLAEVSA